MYICPSCDDFIDNLFKGGSNIKSHIIRVTKGEYHLNFFQCSQVQIKYNSILNYGTSS